MKTQISTRTAAREPKSRGGYPASMYETITLYNESLDLCGYRGHPRDYKRAFALNTQAAAMGYPDAILAMGWFYIGGRGTPSDFALAEHWYRRAARTGDPRAMFSLGGIAYDAGSYTNAKRWFERAANHGHVRSYYYLGKLAWRGHGVKRDRSAAFALFHRAARSNDPEAVRVLRFINRKNH